MRTFSQHGRTALGTIRRYGFSSVRGLEFELLSARRELSALRDDYLELGVQASTLAGERSMAIAARKKTEAYIAFIRSDREVEVESARHAPADHGQGGHMQQAATHGILNGSRQSENISPDENGVKANSKPGAVSNVFDTLKEYLTPRALLLEAEMSSVQQELANLGNDYLELAEHVNTIACERDTAFIALNKAKDLAESLVPDPAVNDQNEGQTIDAISDDSTDELAAISAKLNKTQAEKNDLGIKLAESEDRVAELRLRETQLHKHLDTLNQRLSGRDKENTAALQKAQQLTDELEKAGSVADEQKKLLAGALHKVHDEYAETRHNDRQHIEGLERRIAELEAALVVANRTIEDLRQSLADATYRQKFMGKHAVLFASEPDESSRQHQESLNTAQHRMKAASTETAMADQQASRASWKSVATGFVFLLGVMVSVAKIWDIDSRAVRRTGVVGEVDVGAGTRYDADHRGASQASLSLPETTELASLDTAKIQPAEAEIESGKTESGEAKTDDKEQVSAPELKNQAIAEYIENSGKRRQRTLGRGALVRVYLMEGNDDMDISYDTCLQAGGDTKDCAFLEKNMFEEGVIRLPSGVQYTVIRNGTGASPGLDDIVRVNLRGTLLDGTEFENSRLHGGANSFRVDEAIPGLQDVLQYMEEGAKWEVYIPPELAFKKPAVFGGQTVIFELELISIENPQNLSGKSGATRFE